MESSSQPCMFYLTLTLFLWSIDYYISVKFLWLDQFCCKNLNNTKVDVLIGIYQIVNILYILDKPFYTVCLPFFVCFFFAKMVPMIWEQLIPSTQSGGVIFNFLTISTISKSYFLRDLFVPLNCCEIGASYCSVMCHIKVHKMADLFTSFGTHPYLTSNFTNINILQVGTFLLGHSFR